MVASICINKWERPKYGRAPPTHQKETETEKVNSCLPRELTDMVAMRQHREQFLHARMTVCKSVTPTINSIFAQFRNELEDEKATAFKNYLRQTKACFAASKDLPKPQPAPAHSHPTFINVSAKSKAPVKLAAVTIPLPSSKSATAPERIIPRCSSVRLLVRLFLESNQFLIYYLCTFCSLFRYLLRLDLLLDCLVLI